MRKICFKCSIEKDISEYYKHAQMGDGHLNKCKSCTKNDTKKRGEIINSDPDLYEKEKYRHRQKYYRLNYKEKHKMSAEKKKAAQVSYKSSYPEKKKARNLSGHLRPLTKGNHLHHWSYKSDHAKDVIELSPKDHSAAHRYMTYDQERMMYRTLNGVLLDTKESHLIYIKEVILLDEQKTKEWELKLI